MKIKEMISQHRRDFWAIYECEHCGHEEKKSGYDDRDFHELVIPKMECPKCHKKADENYRPLTTKYHDYETV
jgi:ribosomal protein L37AE/L43A